MIATGGLLRINARRQDAKPHKPRTHRRKTEKKGRSEVVVVVKGKLKVCSVSGLVAVLGILVLLVGVVMAALGYWPRDGLFFRPQTQGGATMASVSSISSTAESADVQGGEGVKDLQRDEFQVGADEEGSGYNNQTEPLNGTARQLRQGFLEVFLDRYLYSDRLKVFGPLIMGVGIFLFICANAVLHENRDKKTKVINLRDIYSTVIDLHSLHRHNTSSCSTHHSLVNPLNGLVNYIQSRSLECKPSAYPASVMSGREGGGGAGRGGMSSSQWLCGQGSVGSDEGNTVFNIYQEQPHIHPLPHPHPPLSTLQNEELSFFTLPLRRPQLPTPRRRHSARARTGWLEGKGRKDIDTQEDACPPSLLCSPISPTTRPFQEELSATSCSSSRLLGEAPGSSQALLLLSSSSFSASHLSISSVSHLVSPCSSVLEAPCRRHSLPTGSVLTGYSKQTHKDNELFESNEIMSPVHVASQRFKDSNMESLRMISPVDSGLRQNKEEG